MSRPEIVEDVIAAAAAVPQALDRLSEEARAAWAGQLAADVAAERRASGVTVAPEAALHRALQARTDELERVRADLAEARAENASLLAVVPAGTHVARVEWGVHAEVTRQRDEILRLTRERDEARTALAEVKRERDEYVESRGDVEEAIDRSLRWLRERDEARATCSELRQAVATIEAAYDRAVSERDTVRSAISRVARTIDEHDTNADMFEWGDEALASVRAVVEEFLRAQGHPVADEWATRRFAIPTAPDVGSTTSAPAAGAADPHQPSARALAWACTVFGDQTT